MGGKKEQPTTNFVKILFVDDEQVIHETVGDFLAKWGYTLIKAYSGEEAIRIFSSEDIDLVITDIRLPECSGIEVLKQIKEISPVTEVILMTGYAQVETAVKALRHGATDYILKPIDLTELLTSIERTKKYHQIHRENHFLKKQVEKISDSIREEVRSFLFLTRNPEVKGFVSLIHRVAGFEKTPILITGETGTGKEVAAKAVHFLSERKNAPFICINCTAVPRELIESELFGCEKGAFTDAKAARKGYIEEADGGTLFLDEIGDMDIQLQSKLLRVLEDQTVHRIGSSRDIKVNVRIISATNKDLEERIREGLFRMDLFFRLNAFPIHLPPLRDRREDILPLAEYFMRFYASQCSKEVSSISGDARESLLSYSYPGNIRELRNLIERAVILSEGGQLQSAHFPSLMVPMQKETGTQPIQVVNEDTTLDRLEKNAIHEALLKAGGNRRRASEALGISYDTFRYRLKKHKMEQFKGHSCS